MYTFPFVIFFNFFTLVPVVTPQPVQENPAMELRVPSKGVTRTYTVSTKCPSELVGIQSPGSKMFHTAVDLGLSCINSGSFIHKADFKQVCV